MKALQGRFLFRVQGGDLVGLDGLDHFRLYFRISKSLFGKRQALAFSLWLLNKTIGTLGSLTTTGSRRRSWTALCDCGIEHVED